MNIECSGLDGRHNSARQVPGNFTVEYPENADDVIGVLAHRQLYHRGQKSVASGFATTGRFPRVAATHTSSTGLKHHKLDLEASLAEPKADDSEDDLPGVATAEEYVKPAEDWTPTLSITAKRPTYEEGGGNAVDSDKDFEDEDEDEELDSGWNGGLFTEENIKLFRHCMKDIVLPTGITRLPSNLGESKHGKLKASQWHSLFAFIIPLIVLQIYVLDVEDILVDSNRGRILLNIADLVQCTNIVTTKAVTRHDADMFAFFYKRYHKNSLCIFGNMGVVPNHHYALHIPDQLRRWGPLNQVSEFAGERLIGMLQGIQTNTHLAEMDKTMLRRFAQLQRLMGDHPIDENTVSEELTKSKAARRKIELKDYKYDALLSYVKSKTPEVRSHRKLPHPRNAKVLHPHAIPKPSWKISQYLSVSVLKPNNCIKYKDNGKTAYAMIKQIYVFTNPSGDEQTELLVNPILNVFPKDLSSPSKHFRYILHLLKCIVGQVEDRCIFVSPSNVIAVAAYRLLPNDTLSVSEGGIILRPFDHQSQLE
ncbi:uncharacterized protein MELLADRAFT_117259 [Melampsora larici-populina 98AG31]|uniref:Uncharacterized protein n=1 Tax=Melampsora larici-populina (strain 98AG31 / pathotype 3-4-7) TaxID=747676 RepID=F4RV69_MELLP|nr:uncharacterized protein MELLADRAFT_117259 [Melampsora larici-populina 98AG31]EGG03721.1 hypothetical protein MELLADRAFT_117259 [Melampsora larici-populina 98AG31]